MKSWIRALAACAVAVATGPSCSSEDRGAYVKRVESPAELVGGPGALGDLGDWVIGNNEIRLIIQDQGWSRGFGIFGGGIIDADLVRPGAQASGAGRRGNDNFGELFPALFLQAFDVSDVQVLDPETDQVATRPAIEIVSDGSDGGPAILRTRATGGDFLTMVSELVNLAVPQDGLVFETDFIIRPGARHVEIVGRLINNDPNRSVDLGGGGLDGLVAGFGIDDLQIPLGDVLLFGAGNQVFAPGGVETPEDAGANVRPVGFDLRFSVEASYASQARNDVSLPALPGLVTDFLATSGRRVSYGFAVGESDRNYVWLNRDAYGRDAQVEPTKYSMLVPFLISSFTGAYFEVPPDGLAPAGQDGSVFEYTRYFIIGDGDVASIRSELFDIRGTPTGVFEGRVVNERTGQPETAARVHILDAQQRPYSQAATDARGRFRAELEPGTYYYRVTAPGRYPYPGEADVGTTEFEIEEEAGAYRHILMPPPAELSVRVRDARGRLLPAKVSVVSDYPAEYQGQKPRDFLFDYWLGQRRRSTDFSWREGADGPGRFVERVLRTADGHARGTVRPSRCGAVDSYWRPGERVADIAGDDCERLYDIYVSRGIEYTVDVYEDVRLRAGELVELEATLERVVDTTDYISADLHVHSRGSVDSFEPLTSQARQAAAEGLEILVSTDHNYITDYQPAIASVGVQDWVSSVTGVELTTLEMGHFNAFPLRYEVAPPSHFPFVDFCYPPRSEKTNRTGFDWVLCSPDQIFDQLRSLGAYGPDQTIVQVNHPRDTILGYFNQFYMNPYTAEPEEPDPDNHPEAGFFIYPNRSETDQYEPESFSFEFDALEVFNGKRQDLLHAFRLPEDAPQALIEEKQDYLCGSGHPDNGPGKILLQHGGHIAYPGGVDDWLNMLNIMTPEQAPVATGNSDSHNLEDEIGSPRTYIHVPRDEDGKPRDRHPQRVSPLDLVEGLRSKRVAVTNGPFLDVQVVTRAADAVDPPCRSFNTRSECVSQGCEWPQGAERCLPPARLWNMGDVVEYADDASSTPVKFRFSIRRTAWVDVERLVIYANGERLRTLELPEESQDERVTVIPWEYEAGFDEDTVIVVEAYGSKNLFPMVTPKEEPPTNLDGALGGLASGLGLDLSSFGTGDGVRAPSYIQKVTPYALANPIWLDINANGEFDPPGNSPGPGPAPDGECPEPERSVQPRRPRLNGQMIFGTSRKPAHYPVWDIRKLLPLHGKH